jgi:hypothetical protein
MKLFTQGNIFIFRNCEYKKHRIFHYIKGLVHQIFYSNIVSCLHLILFYKSTIMSAFDGNRDGFIDRGEANDAREFGAGDFNRDGALNRAEFSRVDSMLMNNCQ